MKMAIQKNVAISVLSLALISALSSCASKTKTAEATNKTHSTSEPALNPAVMDTTQATAMSGGSNYTMIEFKRGSDQLTETSRQALKNLSLESEHQTSRRIGEIKVLAWADREYPAVKAKASKKELALADRRAESIKKFMKDDLKLSVDVDKHNMAKRPGMFSEMIKTEDYKIKTNFEDTGAAPTAANDTQKHIMGSKVSKAVVFIKYK
ncbi:MAG: hypothetical protein H7256_05355 [Bdellovibrio sp.]|nr:hypothetical protein [Bdellovibrio sp.]